MASMKKFISWWELLLEKNIDQTEKNVLLLMEIIQSHVFVVFEKGNRKWKKIGNKWVIIIILTTVTRSSFFQNS